MAKLIKRGSVDLGDIEPDSGLAERAPSGGNVISGKTFEAKAEAQSIRDRADVEAQAIIADAQAQAQAILEQAQQDGEELRAQAKSQGYEQGRAQGALELSKVVATSSARLQQIEQQAVPQLKDLALSIAKKILGRELEFSPDSVVDIVKQALIEKARQRREIFLRVHPDDLDEIRVHKADLLEVLSRCKEIGIREDPDVKRYGVVIETDAGIIDAQLETQLAVFERILKSG